MAPEKASKRDFFRLTEPVISKIDLKFPAISYRKLSESIVWMQSR